MSTTTKDSRNMLIEEVSKALQTKVGAFFVGAGVSAGSKLPSWQKLIESEASQLGLALQAGEDLTAIAQYVVNKYVGNRGPLINQVRAVLRKHSGPNPYHQAMANSAADLIWTTNYDTLIEDAFAGFSLAVRNSDAAISHPADDAEVEIIKMHGCLAHSGHEDLVITKEDYEDFFYRRPATAERLRTDLLRRTFLFIGYSYADPNIQNIVVEARRLAAKATRRHYLIQRRIAATGGKEQLALRQQLWVNDLRRIGIECLLIDDYAELQTILDEVASRSRGATLYVTGSHENNNGLATEIGHELAKCKAPEIVVVDGQSSGLSRNVITAFSEECVNQKLDLRNRLRIFPNPYAANPAFSNDIKLLPMLKQVRRTLLRSTQAVIAFDGGMGTKMEVELAQSLGCNIIPIPLAPGGYASKLFSDSAISGKIKAACPQYFGKLEKNEPVSASDVTQCVAAMLK